MFNWKLLNYWLFFRLLNQKYFFNIVEVVDVNLILKKFNLQIFKSILDSGEVDINFFYVLVGKNERGITNILRALYKINDFNKESYSRLREYPRTFFP